VTALEVAVIDLDARLATLEAPAPTTSTSSTTTVATTTTVPTTTTVVATTTSTTPPSACIGVSVATSANLGSLAAANPVGTTFCLPAATFTLSGPIVAKQGQRWIGALGPGGERLTVISGGDVVRQFLSCTCPDVTLANIVIERFASTVVENTNTQEGTFSGTFPRMTIINVEARRNWGAGIVTHDGAIVRDSYIHDNRWHGFIGQGNDVLIENNEISYNNCLDLFNWGWSGGGAKWVDADGLIVRDNWAHHNGGPGLWTDGDNSGILYEDNRVEDNHGPGIMHEIGGSAIIRNNTLTGNAFGNTGAACDNRQGGGYGGGILIPDSHDVEVYGNTLSGNDGGIVQINDARGVGHDARNNWVHDNDISQTSGGYPVAGCLDNEAGDNCYLTSYNNRFSGNRYHVLGYTTTPFHWLNARRTFATWQGYGFDLTGAID
jgi:parallel beta-helix repeat protein